MKNIFTLSFVLLFSCWSLNLSAQSPRMTVVEEATQASCPPCAALNPPLQALLDQNKDKAIFVGYQVDWPGVDPMNLDNPTEVRERIEYYDMSAAPSIVIQGNSGAGPTNTLTQEGMDVAFAEAAEFDLELSAGLNGDQLSISGLAKANTAVTGNLKLHLLILEKLIVNEDLEFTGTNGETEFHHVFKKYVYGSEGLDLSDDWQAGDTHNINENFDISELNVYNKSELEVVAFVQNADNKFIYQAAKEGQIDFTVDFDNNVAADAIDGLPNATCSGDQEVTPIFSLENTGNETLTSATIDYNVNGGPNQSFEWEGELTTYKKESVTLPAITYSAETTSTVNITVSNPNGVTDEDDSDNAISSSEIIAPLNKELVVLEIFTDRFGAETYWEIRNEAEEILTFGGNPNVGLTNFNNGTSPAPNHPDAYGNGELILETFIIESNDCYTFHMTDFSENGLSAPFGGQPYYKLSNIFGDTLVYGRTNNFREIISNFQGDLTSSVADLVETSEIQLTPNPTQGYVMLNFELLTPVNASIQIINAIGQQVGMKDLGFLNSGEVSEQMDLSNLPNGVYFVQLKLDDELVTKKLTITK